uniref:hypothetical protein n=1 Tax=Flavobacterium sp. TaxID=239 RepID=UPI00404A74C9
MKVYTKILLILTIALCYNCDRKQKQIETWNNRIAEVKSDSIRTEIPQSSEKSKPDKIVGKYYVDNFYDYLESGFELKFEKPQDNYTLYSFEFKKNGELIFKDLTEFYDCGNSILLIEKGKWKVKENGIYELTFEGEYALETKFHSESEYNLIDLRNGNIKMELNKVLVFKRKTAQE